METKIELNWNYGSRKIYRKFTREWAKDEFINSEKIPGLVEILVTERQSMIDYIDALHNKIDDIIERNNICDMPSCHTAGCTSDHK